MSSAHLHGEVKVSEGNGFTPTQKLMLAILSDGKMHTLMELKSCCGPCSPNTVNSHLKELRKKLLPKGEDVVCVFRHGYYYQHVRLLYVPTQSGS